MTIQFLPPRPVSSNIPDSVANLIGAREWPAQDDDDWFDDDPDWLPADVPDIDAALMNFDQWRSHHGTADRCSFCPARDGQCCH